ncbi:MAG: flavin reductase family protein [Saprospiraceae bacterium]|nr:flavin reductase family protein [Saprospiraceae bacterium]
MLTIDPKSVTQVDLHQYMLACISPRPIAFVSTMDAEGRPNLAPYSFFNAFSSNPPVLIFSSNRKASDNTTKDTLHNVRETGEVVINAVNFSMVRQMALASIEYPPEVNEFEKAGFTPIPSTLVRPFRVAESPAQMECRVREVITLGDQGGAGHLIICDVLLIHINEAVLDERGRVDPHKIDLMGRMGRFYYVRASGEAIYNIEQRVNRFGMGFDRLPEGLRHSKVLTGNNLAQLAALPLPPDDEAIAAIQNDPRIADILQNRNPLDELHRIVQIELAKEEVNTAACLAWWGETELHKKPKS